ncbi:unnamed protein product [Rotaria sp. Silwood1]|nr:unnamed protein product [Rotaria sp. Silwood1]
MAEKIKPSLYTLPTELIYRILNYLDDFNLFCTMRNVCTRINTIMDSYRRYKTLTTLYIAENQIGDQGAQYLANALQINRTLTILYVAQNQIGDEGAQHFANALQQNQVTVIDFTFSIS